MLIDDEIERYARHLVLREVGGPGQAALKRARVLVIGAGGLGAPALLYLAAAGVGTLGIIDNDTVSLSNLQRQVIHATTDIGRPKIESAAAAVARLNPHVQSSRWRSDLIAGNALDPYRSTISSPTVQTILQPATWYPMPATLRASHWSPRRLAYSTGR